MLSITDGGTLARALALPLPPAVKRLLAERSDQLGGDIADQAHFIVVEPGDTPAAVADALGFPLFLDDAPTWEWGEQHGFASELVFIFDDGGFAHVLIVPNEPGIDTDLIALCAEHA